MVRRHAIPNDIRIIAKTLPMSMSPASVIGQPGSTRSEIGSDTMKATNGSANAQSPRDEEAGGRLDQHGDDEVGQPSASLSRALS